MTYDQAAVRHSAASGGAVAILGCGLVLYQLTTLVLGPQGNHQLHVSISLPAVESQDGSDPIQARATVVVGNLVSFVTATPTGSLAPGRPAVQAPQSAHRATAVVSHAVVPAVTQPVPAVAPQPKSQPLPVPVPSVTQGGSTAEEGDGRGAHEGSNRTRDRESSDRD